MKSILLILNTILLNACSPQIHVRKIDSLAEPFVVSFEHNLGHQINFTVEMIDIPVSNKTTKVVGLCYTNIPKVEIDLATFQMLTDLEREELVWHELGHCQLGREHINTMNSDGFPLSIMYPNLFLFDGYYEEHHDEYTNELMDKSNIHRFITKVREIWYN